MNQTSAADVLTPLAILAGVAIVGAVVLTWIRRKLRAPDEAVDGSSELLNNPNLGLDAETRQKIARAAANRALGRANESIDKVVTTRCPQCAGVRPVGQPCPWCQEQVEPKGKTRRWHEDKNHALSATYNTFVFKRLSLGLP